MIVEFNYVITHHGEITDTCYTSVSIDGDELCEIIDELMEDNSPGLLSDLPNKYMKRFVDAAIKDAVEIYPDFPDDNEEYAVMLQKYLPQAFIEYLPDELLNTFDDEMFDGGKPKTKSHD
ncbi:MAG: hypothetical protein LUC49_06485 [Prevotella sp.]|nr:hypothetical protein [Prevotella sp.]